MMKVTCHLPSRHSTMISLCPFFEAVRIHGRHNVDPSGVNQASDAVIAAVRFEKILDKEQKHLATHGLVAMHVAHVLEL